MQEESKEIAPDQEVAPEHDSEEYTAPADEKDECSLLKERIAELEENALRAAAEFENYKKRSARLTDEFIKGANDRLVGELLDIFDNFDRALHHAQGQSDPSAVLKGTELTFAQMQQFLEKQGVTAIESVGKPFDPRLHDALTETYSEAVPEGHIVFEISKGFLMHDRIIRHARVGVSKGRADSAVDQSGQSVGHKQATE